jgi:hypothetical protein
MKRWRFSTSWRLARWRRKRRKENGMMLASASH